MAGLKISQCSRCRNLTDSIVNVCFEEGRKSSGEVAELCPNCLYDLSVYLNNPWINAVSMVDQEVEKFKPQPKENHKSWKEQIYGDIYGNKELAGDKSDLVQS